MAALEKRPWAGIAAGVALGAVVETQ